MDPQFKSLNLELEKISEVAWSGYHGLATVWFRVLDEKHEPSRRTVMAKVHNDEFKREAVRIALTSGQPRRQVASDLGVGFSTLAKWIQKSRPGDLPPASDIDLAKENERLRKENRLLTEERELLKKATMFFAAQNK